MIKPYFIAIGAILIAVAIGWHMLDKKVAVRAAIKATEISMNSEYTNKLNEAKEETRNLEKKLQEDKDNALREKDEQIKNINTKLDSALSSLQFYKKCSSSAGNSSDTSIGKACPGRELSREDAEFLIREAARADTVAEERNYYYERYENARSGLESRTESTTR